MAARTVTDGGMETDLIFNHGVDLPHFAAFPLLGSDRGQRLLTDYYEGYARIAARAHTNLSLESPTWRANPDWAQRLGYDAAALARANRDAVSFLIDLRDAYRERFGDDLGEIRVVGMVGPRGDGYLSDGPVDPDEAQRYHRPQIEAFAASGADSVSAYTLTDSGEAIGVVRAARAVGIPVAVSFTVETDGRLAGGIAVADAVATVDAAAPPDHYLLNCAHPTHIARALADGDGWKHRIQGLRCNASPLSHAELDEAEELDDGDPTAFADAHTPLLQAFPNLDVLGGCCGTDARHVSQLWARAPVPSRLETGRAVPSLLG